MHVIATAGHVDHGKSSLILALSGIDPDRWIEEKERGLTIDLGFAHTTLASGKEISLVDVPGHIRFIKNMLAGVGAVDGVLFVIAANEGWKPQSEEHLRILDLLGIKNGIIVLTKSGLVDDNSLELAQLEVAERVTGTFLENSRIVAVDSFTREGFEELASAIESLVEETPTSPNINRPRLWIDRVFSSRGSGTVVTGTLLGGAISLDQELGVFHSSGKTWDVLTASLGKSFLPDLEDWSSKVRVRGLQSHGEKLSMATPGRRLAVNLANLAAEDISRGDVLIDSGQWCATGTFDASLKVLSNLDHPVTKRGAYTLYLGSGDFPVKISILNNSEIAPGEKGFIRAHLRSLVPLTRGDRFVLRELGRQETVAGGKVLNVHPLHSPTGAPTTSTQDIVEHMGVCSVSLLYKMTGETIQANLGVSSVISNHLRDTLTNDLLSRAKLAGEIGFDISELDEISRDLLSTIPELTVDSSRVYSTNLGSLKDTLSNHPYLDQLNRSPYSPPTPEGITREQLRELVKRNLIVESGGIYFPLTALKGAKNAIWEMCKSGNAFTVSELREHLGTSRKYILPLVNYLDSQGFTRRAGDFRVPGPALIREFNGNQIANRQDSGD